MAVNSNSPVQKAIKTSVTTPGNSPAIVIVTPGQVIRVTWTTNVGIEQVGRSWNRADWEGKAEGANSHGTEEHCWADQGKYWDEGRGWEKESLSMTQMLQHN